MPEIAYGVSSTSLDNFHHHLQPTSLSLAFSTITSSPHCLQIREDPSSMVRHWRKLKTLILLIVSWPSSIIAKGHHGYIWNMLPAQPSI